MRLALGQPCWPLFRILVETRSSRFESDAEVPLASALFPGHVLPSGDVMRLLPQLTGPGSGRPSWPASRYLRVSCRPAMEEMTDDREYTAAFDRYEFLRGMLEHI